MQLQHIENKEKEYFSYEKWNTFLSSVAVKITHVVSVICQQSGKVADQWHSQWNKRKRQTGQVTKGPIKIKWMTTIIACKSVCLDMPDNSYWKEYFIVSCKLTEIGEIQETQASF